MSDTTDQLVEALCYAVMLRRECELTFVPVDRRSPLADVEKARRALDEHLEKLEAAIDDAEEALQGVAEHNDEGFCLLCGLYPCIKGCEVGEALKTITVLRAARGV